MTRLADFRQCGLGSRTAETVGVGAATHAGGPLAERCAGNVTAPQEYIVVP